MIYILLLNGASTVPLYLPGIPQIMLLSGVLFYSVRAPFHFSTFEVVVFVNFLILAFISILKMEPYFGISAIKLAVNVIVSSLLANVLHQRFEGRFSEKYSMFMVVFSTVGILGLIFFELSSFQISKSIGPRLYSTNFLTVWITDSGYNSSQTVFSPFTLRLQSFFDEPGTFGVLLVPALFHFVKQRRHISAAVIFCAIFLSESLNAIALAIILLIFMSYNFGGWPQRLGLLITIAVGIYSFWAVILLLIEVKFGLGHGYQNFSSYSARSYEFQYLVDNFWTYFWPLENLVIFEELGRGFSVAYIRWYLIAGVPIILIFMYAFVKFTYISLRLWRVNEGDVQFALVLLGVLLISGLQRSSFIDNVLFMTLTFWALRCKKRIKET